MPIAHLSVPVILDLQPRRPAVGLIRAPRPLRDDPLYVTLARHSEQIAAVLREMIEPQQRQSTIGMMARSRRFRSSSANTCSRRGVPPPTYHATFVDVRPWNCSIDCVRTVSHIARNPGQTPRLTGTLRSASLLAEVVKGNCVGACPVR